MEMIIQTIDAFGGVDLTDPAWTVAAGRSPEGTNMTRDVPGRVRKRMGYETMYDFGERINGIFSYGGDMIVHAGHRLYKYTNSNNPVILASDLADRISCGMNFGEYLLLLDGNRYRAYDGNTVFAAEDRATVPTLTIATPPSGGGTFYSAVNLLTSKRKQSFYGTAEDRVYVLAARDLDGTAVTAELLLEDGTRETVTEGVGLSVDRENGTVTFGTAPGVSPITGEDNVVITYGKTTGGNAGRINGCRFMIAYGAYGNSDRVFACGNPDYPAGDFYSGINDPFYFPDTGYLQTGSADAPITGYSVTGSALGVHKSGEPYNRNLFLRQGEADENGEPVFRVTDIIQGPGAVNHRCCVMGNEPLFLTPEGICSATPYEYGGGRYIQNRSYYLNGRLCRENPADTHAVMFRGMYLLAAGNRIYAMDTTQRSAAEGDIRTAGRYEGYLWRGPEPRVMAVIGDRLWFGDDYGALCRFFDDPDSAESCSDDGYPISARWDINFTGKHPFRRKFLRYFGLCAAPSGQYDVYVRTDGSWRRTGETPSSPPGEDPVTSSFAVRSGGTERAVISIRSGGCGRPLFISKAGIEFYEGESIRM